MSISNPQSSFHFQISEWLETNKPLPKGHIGTLNQFLEAQRSACSSLDREIHDLQEALKARKDQQAKLKVAVETHQRLLSPIRRLPVEIMQHIFLFCRNTRRLSLLHAQEVPLLLTHVCRDWRNLAHETPLLWDRIHIPIPEKFDEQEISVPMACVERWLDAAKQSPLSISLSSFYERSSKSDIALENFIRKTILDRAPQIRYLELDLSRSFLDFITAAVLASSWTALEKIRLKRSEDDEDPANPSFTTVVDLPIWEAPNLRRVEFEAVKSDILSLPINWRQVEEIRVYGDASGGDWDSDWDEFSASQAHALIRDSPNLQNLEVSVNDDGTEFFLEGQVNVAPLNWETPLVLAHLTRLELMDVYIDPASSPITFLHGLKLPALDTLSYRLNIKDERHPPQPLLGALPLGDAHPLVAFLKAQARPIHIKNFRIPDGSTMCQSDFIKCLRLIPRLERLWVEDSRLNYLSDGLKLDPQTEVAPNAALLRQLQPPEGGLLGVLCPLLRTLKLDRMGDVELDDIEAFVTARLSLARRYPILSSEASTSSANHPPIYYPGFAKLERLYIGLLKNRPDHVPRRGYGHEQEDLGFLTSPERRVPSCALEEDLWEQGVNVKIRMWKTNWENREAMVEKELYEANGGRTSSWIKHGRYDEGWWME